jgi:hypothetical protein
MPVLENINTESALARCRANFIRQGGAGGPRRSFKNGDGQMLYSFPAKAYYHAIRNLGADPRDKGYWEDMAKRYPECRVGYVKKSNQVSGGHGMAALPGFQLFSGRTQTVQHTLRARLARGGKLGDVLKCRKMPGVPAARVQQ